MASSSVKTVHEVTQKGRSGSDVASLEPGISANADEVGRLPIVVVGNGPVGMRVVADLFALDRKQAIVLYGEEEHLPYDRIKLSSWLAGEVDLDAIEKPYRRPFGASLDERYGVKVVSIDRDSRTVLDSQGNRTSYQSLILATGSTPHIPPVLGIERQGVYTLRDMSDALQLMARRVRSHHTVVIGGGLLGLEAARGMQPTNTSVTIIEHVDRLMANQLDERSGELLKETIEGMGFNVIVGDGIKFIRGTSQVDAVVLHSGRIIECDTVVVATGIRPNITLAQNCGLSIGRGITVDNSMRTSDPHIFAIGECAEHDGEVYGLVAPGFEQAGVAASAIAGVHSHYRGSIVASRLKVIGTQVFSVGPVGYTAHPAAGKSLVYEDPDKGIYRKLLINRDKLQGAISLGDWPQSLRTQGAVSRHDRLYPWQRIRFRRTGNIWSDNAGNSVSSWPESTIVCQCTNVNRGRISETVSQGAQSIEAIGLACGAGTVCGSCKPLLAELSGDTASASEAGTDRARPLPLGLIAASAAACAAIVTIPRVPYAETVQSVELFGHSLSWHWDVLWRSGLLKQITGFTVLGCIAVASLISVRKRVSKLKSVGEFDSWRTAHLLLSAFALFALLLHTGLRMGSGLNYLLMLTFVLLSVLGVSTGLIQLFGHKLAPGTTAFVRKHSLHWHIYLLWPVPLLLGWHILKGYWY